MAIVLNFLQRAAWLRASLQQFQYDGGASSSSFSIGFNGGVSNSSFAGAVLSGGTA